MTEWVNEFGITMSVDATGHQHRGKGAGGGQFTGDRSDVTTAQPLTDKEKKAVQTWALGNDDGTDGYEQINQAARSGGSHWAIKLLDSSIEKSAQLASDKTFYRGIGIDRDHPLIKSLREGNILTDKGFQAVTDNMNTLSHFSTPTEVGQVGVRMKINVPKGTKLLPVEASGIGEYLVGRGSRLLIKDVKRDGDVINVSAEFVSQTNHQTHTNDGVNTNTSKPKDSNTNKEIKKLKSDLQRYVNMGWDINAPALKAKYDRLKELTGAGLSIDATGHQHKGAGVGGGQFVKGGSRGGNREDTSGADIGGGEARGAGGDSGGRGDDTGAARGPTPAELAVGVTPERFSDSLTSGGVRQVSGLSRMSLHQMNVAFDAQKKSVAAVAKERGLYVDREDLPKIVKHGRDVGGEEHNVYQDAENSRFYKVTKTPPGEGFGIGGDILAYTKRHEVANKLWPELDYRFHGVVNRPDEHKHEWYDVVTQKVTPAGVRDNPQVIMSMARVAGTHPSEEEVAEFFTENGWVPGSGAAEAGSESGTGEGGFTWHDPVSGTVIGDAHSGNLIKTAGGIVPIDVNITPGNGTPAPLRTGKPSAAALALWANEVLRACLLEAGDDVPGAIAAADIILSTQPLPGTVGASLATDASGREHGDAGSGHGGQFVGNGQSSTKLGGLKDGHKSAGQVKLGGHNVHIAYDPSVTSEEDAERFAQWIKDIPQSQLNKSVAKYIEVYSDSRDVGNRLEEVGIDPEISDNGEVRGAFDFETGTLYASCWDGYQNSPHNLYHELGHSILGMDEDQADSWATAHMPNDASMSTNATLSHHAPPGEPTVIGGKEYAPGQFIPAGDLGAATPDEAQGLSYAAYALGRAAIRSGDTEQHAAAARAHRTAAAVRRATVKKVDAGAPRADHRKMAAAHDSSAAKHERSAGQALSVEVNNNVQSEVDIITERVLRRMNYSGKTKTTGNVPPRTT